MKSLVNGSYLFYIQPDMHCHVKIRTDCLAEMNDRLNLMLYICLDKRGAKFCTASF